MNPYFKKIMRFALPYKKYAYLNIFFNVLYALFSTLSFVSLMPMMDVLFKQETKIYEEPVYRGLLDLKRYAGDYLNYYMTMTTENYGISRTLGILVVGIITVFLLKNACDYFANFFITFLRNGVIKDLRDTMYQKTISLPLAFYSEKRKGDTIARLSNDVNEVQASFLSILELIIKEPLTIVFTIGAMFMISVKLTIFVFIFIPISGYIISLVGKQLKKKSTRAQQEQGHILSTIEETVGGLKVIKGYNAENHFITIFRNSTAKYFKLSNSIINRQNLASPLSEIMGISVIATLLWYGGHMVLVEESLKGGAFITYMGLAYNILTPAKAISKASYGVKKGNAAAERILEVLEQENPITDKPDAIEKDTFSQGISIANVDFAYSDRNVLSNFSLEIPKGQTIALVGQSGSGKSTITNLLMRFYDVDGGRIAIDGADIRDMKMESVRGLIGLVTQTNILFNDTIRNNVALGKPDATDAEVIDALKVANAYEFIEKLPNGIHTNVGDSGGLLSGGQQQRLSIARAVLKNPPIMILDEATSSLDAESERYVQKALENMMQNRTSIVIAHRLSTIQKADKIVVMQHGKIVEQGSHDELIVKGGAYQKLVAMQSFE
jgi:ATP-binding cassette, subfamily B, bacterial MsbA